MKISKTATKDPICGMTVDVATAIHAEHEGKTHYFCGDSCRKKFLALPTEKKTAANAKGCCE